MLEFILEYWVQFLLTTIVGALGFFCKKFYSLYMNEKNHQKTKEQKEFYKGLEDLIKAGSEESHKGDEELQKQINIMQEGILSIQGRNFKQECREFLRKGPNEVSLDDFEILQDEHNIYKNLGGNHDGDMLYEMVCRKVQSNISNDK